MNLENKEFSRHKINWEIGWEGRNDLWQCEYRCSTESEANGEKPCGKSSPRMSGERLRNKTWDLQSFDNENKYHIVGLHIPGLNTVTLIVCRPTSTSIQVWLTIVDLNIPGLNTVTLTLNWPRGFLGTQDLFFAHFTTFACAFFHRYFV